MVFLALLFVLTGIDQAVKAIALKYFSEYVLINSLGPFSIKGGSLLFAILSLTVIVFFLFVVRKRLLRDKYFTFATVLIISGGTSNVMDRFIHHGVVDFIDFKIWPSFNLADVFISVGVVLIVLNEIKSLKNSKPSLHS